MSENLNTEVENLVDRLITTVSEVETAAAGGGGHTPYGTAIGFVFGAICGPKIARFIASEFKLDFDPDDVKKFYRGCMTNLQNCDVPDDKLRKLNLPDDATSEQRAEFRKALLDADPYDSTTGKLKDEKYTKYAETRQAVLDSFDESGNLKVNSKPGKAVNLKRLKPRMKITKQVSSKGLGGHFLGGVAGAAAGGVVDFVLADGGEYSLDMSSGDGINCFGKTLSVDTELVKALNEYHQFGEEGTKKMLDLATKVQGYIKNYDLPINPDEFFGQVVSGLVKYNGSMSDYLKSGDAPTDLVDKFQKLKTAVSSLNTKAEQFFGSEKWYEFGSPDELAEDIAIKMIEGSFYSLLKKADEQANENSQTNVQHNSEQNSFMAAYGQKVSDVSEDATIRPQAGRMV